MLLIEIQYHKREVIPRTNGLNSDMNQLLGKYEDKLLTQTDLSIVDASPTYKLW